MSFLGLNKSDKELQEMVEADDKRSRISVAIGCSIFSIFLSIVLAALIYGGYQIYRTLRASARLDAHGQTIQGHLDGKTTYFSLVMGDGYTVRYSFTLNDVTYQGSGSLADDPGSPPAPVSVIYDPENPKNNRIKDDLGMLGPLASKKTWLWFITAFLVIGVFSLIKSALGNLLRGRNR